MAYLTKSYALLFFLATFILFNIFHYFNDLSKEKKKKLLKNFLLGLAVFFIISGAWSAIISGKYGELTFSTSGKYNYEVQGPLSAGHPTQDPDYGFIKPPNQKAISAWEDPSYFEFKPWSPFKSWKSLYYQLEKVSKNTSISMIYIGQFSYFSLLIILVYLLICLQPVKKLIKVPEFYPLITIFIFLAGYLLIAVEDRYLWLIYVLLVLMGGHLLYLLFKSNLFSSYAKVILITIFALSFLVMPVSGLFAYKDGDRYIYDTAQALNEFNITGNIASNGNAENGNYRMTLHLSYFLGTSYYGFPKSSITDKELDSELKKHNIDYYFVWGKTNNEALFSKYREISNGKINNLRIYSIN